VIGGLDVRQMGLEGFRGFWVLGEKGGKLYENK
jgi:hypothetical protein